jgi:hypothetical protein
MLLNAQRPLQSAIFITLAQTPIPLLMIMYTVCMSDVFATDSVLLKDTLYERSGLHSQNPYDQCETLA